MKKLFYKNISLININFKLFDKICKFFKIFFINIFIFNKLIRYYFYQYNI